jgi:hypothetical protein
MPQGRLYPMVRRVTIHFSLIVGSNMTKLEALARTIQDFVDERVQLAIKAYPLPPSTAASHNNAPVIGTALADKVWGLVPAKSKAPDLADRIWGAAPAQSKPFVPYKAPELGDDVYEALAGDPDKLWSHWRCAEPALRPKPREMIPEDIGWLVDPPYWYRVPSPLDWQL